MALRIQSEGLRNPNWLEQCIEPAEPSAAGNDDVLVFTVGYEEQGGVVDVQRHGSGDPDVRVERRTMVPNDLDAGGKLVFARPLRKRQDVPRSLIVARRFWLSDAPRSTGG